MKSIEFIQFAIRIRKARDGYCAIYASYDELIKSNFTTMNIRTFKQQIAHFKTSHPEVIRSKKITQFTYNIDEAPFSNGRAWKTQWEMLMFSIKPGYIGYLQSYENSREQKQTPSCERMKIVELYLENNPDPINRVNATIVYSKRLELLDRLQAYIDRIDSYDRPESSMAKFKHNFYFFATSRAANRIANYRLAQSLIETLKTSDKNIADIFDKTQLSHQRNQFFKEDSYIRGETNRGINSSELLKIIEDACKFNEPMEINIFYNSPNPS